MFVGMWVGTALLEAGEKAVEAVTQVHQALPRGCYPWSINLQIYSHSHIE